MCPYMCIYLLSPDKWDCGLLWGKGTFLHLQSWSTISSCTALKATQEAMFTSPLCGRGCLIPRQTVISIPSSILASFESHGNVNSTTCPGLIKIELSHATRWSSRHLQLQIPAKTIKKIMFTQLIDMQNANTNWIKMRFAWLSDILSCKTNRSTTLTANCHEKYHQK